LISCATINFCAYIRLKVFKFPFFANTQTVTGHAKRRNNQQKIERENGQTKCQRFAKLKELQSQAQADTICSTFNFAQPHPSPPTTRLLDKFAYC